MLGWLVWRSDAEPDEPRYRGRSLTWWLGQYTRPFRNARSLQEIQSFDFESMFRETSEAVKAIGTNSIPLLLRYLQARDSRYKSGWLIVAGGLRRGHAYTASEKHHIAQAGFMILQKDALPAIPALIELTHHKDSEVRFRALQSLFFIIPADTKQLVPIIVSFAHDPDAGNRRKAADHMSLMLPLLSEQDVREMNVYGAFPMLERERTNHPVRGPLASPVH